MNLLTLLINAKAPVSVKEIRSCEEFAAYVTRDPKSGERAFERDKSSLVEMGIPLRYIQGAHDDDDAGGYVIDREKYYLQELELEPHQWAALTIAGSGALAVPGLPFAKELVSAMAKMGFDSDEDGTVDYVLLHTPQFPGVAHDVLAKNLECLLDALSLRRRLRVAYRAPGRELSEREFDVYGLFLSRGTWYAVGFCHMRNALRTLLVHRMTILDARQTSVGIDYEVPDDFDLQIEALRKPWNFSGKSRHRVVLRVAPRFAPVMRSIFSSDAVVRGEGDSLQVMMNVDHPESLVPALLPMAAGVEVLEPAPLSDMLVSALNKILSLHGISG